MNGGSGPLEAVVDDGYTEQEVAKLLRDLLAEADGHGIDLCLTPKTFKRGLIWKTRVVDVAFTDGSIFELTVRRVIGSKRP